MGKNSLISAIPSTNELGSW